MPAKIYHVTLTDEERADLNTLVHKGKGVARRLTRSRILLLADENQADDDRIKLHRLYPTLSD